MFKRTAAPVNCKQCFILALGFYLNRSSVTGIYSYKIGNEIEKEIIKITFTLTNNVPIASSILFCTQYTTIEEIISFYMRFIQCQFHIPFFLIGISKLRNEVKGELLNGLKQRERNKIDGLFIFMLNSDEINEYVEILKLFINYRNI